MFSRDRDCKTSAHSRPYLPESSSKLAILDFLKNISSKNYLIFGERMGPCVVWQEFFLIGPVELLIHLIFCMAYIMDTEDRPSGHSTKLV